MATLSTLSTAFVPVAMAPVMREDGTQQNPDLLYPLSAQAYDSWHEELDALIAMIQRTQLEHPTASRAVLCSDNFRVQEITGKLQQAGIPAISHSEQAGSQRVFSILQAFLQVLRSPQDLTCQSALLEKVLEQDLQKLPEDSLARSQSLFRLPTHRLHPVFLNDERLLQLHYDWLDFQRDAASGNLCALLVRMTDQLFFTPAERSQGYWLALQARQFLADQLLAEALNGPAHLHKSALDMLCRHWEASARRKVRNPFSQGLNPADAGFVEVMTLHKSKGQEFDLVWMPALIQDDFPSTPEQLAQSGRERKNRSENQLKEDLAWLADCDPNGPMERSEAIQQELREASRRAILEEKARLLYVGFSRARRGLFLSTHHSTVDSRSRKIRAIQPAWAFKAMAEWLSFNL